MKEYIKASWAKRKDKRFFDLVTCIPDAYFTVDIYGNLEFGNDSLFKLLGFDFVDGIKSLIGKSVKKFIHDEDLKNVTSVFRNVYFQGTTKYSCKFRIVREDKDIRTVDTSISTLLNSKGSIVGFTGVIKDQTNIIKMSDALNEKIVINKMITQNTHEIISVFDMDLKYLFVSPSVFNIRGFTVKETMEQHIHDILTPGSLRDILQIYENEKEKEKEFIKDQTQHRKPVVVIVEEFKKDGTLILVEYTLSFIGSHDNIATRILSVGRDVTERVIMENMLRKNEERFRTLYEKSPICIDGFDRNGKCVLWNKACEKLFGWTKNELNSHDDPLSLFYPDQNIKKEVLDSFNICDEVFREWNLITKDGKTLTMSWANFRLNDGLVINMGYVISKKESIIQELEDTIKKYKEEI